MVNIIRNSSNVDFDVPYTVYIDNVEIFKIVNRETRSVDIKEGKHTIQVKSSKYKSNIIDFEIYENQNIDFTVEPDYQNNAISKFFTNTLYGKLGIKITKTNDFYL